MPLGESDTTLAENFADHFLTKISNIRESLKSYKQFEPCVRDVPRISQFNELNEDDVKSLISDLNTKSSKLDILPTHVLKTYIHGLLPTLTRLVNISLRDGVFPS